MMEKKTMSLIMDRLLSEGMPIEASARPARFGARGDRKADIPGYISPHDSEAGSRKWLLMQEVSGLLNTGK